MKDKYNNHTSIRLDPAIKAWIYTKMQQENRSLGNLVNTILKREKEREENWKPDFKEWEKYVEELNKLDTK